MHLLPEHQNTRSHSKYVKTRIFYREQKSALHHHRYTYIDTHLLPRSEYNSVTTTDASLKCHYPRLRQCTLLKPSHTKAWCCPAASSASERDPVRGAAGGAGVTWSSWTLYVGDSFTGTIPVPPKGVLFFSFPSLSSCIFLSSP